MLASQVKAGKLPALEKRLPNNPYVVPHKWVSRRSTAASSTSSHAGDAPTAPIREYMYGHSPLRCLNDGKDVGPGLVESWSPTTTPRSGPSTSARA